MRFIRRVTPSDYLETRNFTDSGGDNVNVTELPIASDIEALEVEIEGRRYVLLAYETKS